MVTPGTASLCAASSRFGSPVDVEAAEASGGFGAAIVPDTAAAAVANTSSLAAGGGGEGAVTGSEEAAPPHSHAVGTTATGVLPAIY